MTNSILLNSEKKLEAALSTNLKFTDIDYEVCDPRLTPTSKPWTTKRRQTVMRDTAAISNAYRMWLQSKENDYIRNPLFGGMFSNLLRQFPFEPASASAIEEFVQTQSKEKWPDLDVLSVEVKCKYNQKTWNIKIVVMERESKMIIPIDTDTS